MKKLIIFLLIAVFYCNSPLPNDKIILIGHWRYIGETQRQKINILQIKDSTISYYLETLGVYSFKYKLKNEFIVFIQNKSDRRVDTKDKRIQFQLISKDTLLLLGSRTDTLSRVSEELGNNFVEHVLSGMKDYELITPQQ